MNNNMMKRLETIDTLRGLTMISMILFHFCWDLKYIVGFDMEWYVSKGAYIWQQSICWTFILVSGFCLQLARKPIKNGLIVFGCGFLVTMVTMFVVPETLVMFGVLTCIGSCMLIVALINRANLHSNGTATKSLWGFLTTIVLFAITKTINYGYLNFGFYVLELPRFLYTQGGPDGMSHSELTYLGFMQDGFFSTDYFSLMPWLFLFMAGYFLHGLLKNTFAHKLFHVKLSFLSWFGRHSLIVYMLHQPVLYLLSLLIIYLIRK